MAVDPSLAHAIQTLRAGDRNAARTILSELTQNEPLLSEGWLWLAAASDDPAQKRTYLRQVLALNPADQRAEAGLRVLDRQAAATSSTPEAGAIIPVVTTTQAPEKLFTPPSRYAKPQFVAIEERKRWPIPPAFIALICALILLIPLTLLLI